MSTNCGSNTYLNVPANSVKGLSPLAVPEKMSPIAFLIISGLLADKKLRSAVAFMDGLGPRRCEYHVDAIEPDGAIASAPDVIENERPAKAIRRKALKIARAAIVAIARLDIMRLHDPLWNLFGRC